MDVTPAIAEEVAARHLGALAPPRTAAVGPVEWRIDWTGPVKLELRGESEVQAACGIMAVHGRRYGRPTSLPIPYASTVAGVVAVQGVLAAHIDRLRGGGTRRVSTSVAQGALLAVSQYLATDTVDDEPPRPYLAGGPPFTSADGVHFEIETFDALDWRRFWGRLTAADEAIRRGWPPFLHRFATASCPLPEALHRAAGRHRYRSIAAFAADTGVSIVAVGDAVAVSAPWRVTPLPRGHGPRREPGAAPLHGFVVVEATRRLQGPLAGHLLRLLGAEVIRIEPPGGDPSRGVPPMAGDTSARFRALNRGKRVVEVDLRSPAGQEQVRRLVADADVFLHNWAPGRAARWNLDAADLAAVRPGLVHAYASGWGDALGPHPPTGTDYMAQAYSGLAAQLAPEGPAAPSLMTLTDVLGGLLSAEAILAALLTRLHTGYGQRVETSLLSAAGELLRVPVTAQAPPRVPVLEAVADLAADERFAPALEHDGCTFVRPPWEFTS